VSEVRLEAWEWEWAAHVARKRQEANVGKQDAPWYDRNRMENDDVAALASCCCEMAVAKRLNKYWDGSYWAASEHDRFRSNADVGQNTEVRRVRERGNPLPVRKRDVDANRIMALAFAEGPRFDVVEVVGWGWAKDLWEVGEPASYDKRGTTRLVAQEFLWAL